MGMYCCCDVKISGDDYEGKPKCRCDWNGWISTCDFPEDRKNKDTPIQEKPLKSGKYLVRNSTTYGDRYEAEMTFSVEPIRVEKVGYFWPQRDYPVHWSDEDTEVGGPYAWKEILDD